MARANTLSHHRIGAAQRKTPKSLRSIRIQQSSAATETKALYLASAEERETMGYFLADHVIGELPRNTKIPEMDFLSKGSPTQSESL